MKNANVEIKKIINAAQSRRVAGVPVRSGVKAGGVSRKGSGFKSGLTGAERGFTSSY